MLMSIVSNTHTDIYQHFTRRQQGWFWSKALLREVKEELVFISIACSQDLCWMSRTVTVTLSSMQLSLSILFPFRDIWSIISFPPLSIFLPLKAIRGCKEVSFPVVLANLDSEKHFGSIRSFKKLANLSVTVVM